MKLRIPTVVAIASVLLASAVAQDKPKQETKAAPAQPASQTQQASQAQPKPSDEIKKLSRSFVGRWTVTGKILDENWAPGGAEGTGTEVIRRGPGGFSTVSDGRMDFGKMGPFQGHGVIFWDPAKKGYTGYWCDNWAPTCESIGLGKWEGDKLVFNSEMKMGDQTVPMRQTYASITKDGYTWLMETGDGKGGWKPAMSLTYSRAGRPKEAAAKEPPPKQ